MVNYKTSTIIDSKQVAVAALQMSISVDRGAEDKLKQDFAKKKIKVAAVNYGGDSANVEKVIERAIVAAKREQVITESHAEEGAIAGAAHEALIQVLNKAMGLSIGGKIGIARYQDHITVAMVMEIGLLHLNEVAIGMAHRAVH